MNKQKKLYRSTTDRWVAGVLGGLSAYFGWNANLVRVLFIILAFTPATLLVILAYIVMIVIIPNEGTPVSFFKQIKSTYQNSSRKSRKVIHDVDEKDIHGNRQNRS